ncbi:hypothetical protein D9X30_4305 [Cupriavidus sp. U2]|uniref:O-linked N-acetylglucosamine transferase, SPINDLY family protein n=1 Tax=Cupriavidus sp. U2 TaxID=2920269 RepID=UPI00129D6AA3|nr:tetratricopeptide repeat protein [Cupriavidus sp. U2]KAI3590820.1 hypothetical protein D9X30_4305 [Cupriavidus sp. U2]
MKVQASRQSHQAKQTEQLLRDAWQCFHEARFEEADRYATAAQKQNRKNPVAYFIRATAALHQHRFSDAEALLREGLGYFPEHELLSEQLGVTLIKTGRYPEAESILSRCVASSSPSGTAWINYTNVQFQLSNYAAAKHAAQRALAIFPDDAQVLSNYGSTLLHTGLAREAIEQFRKACKLSPADHAARSNLLYALLFDDELSAVDIRQEAEEAGRHFVRYPTASTQPAKQRSTVRLRLGILSADFNRHACAYFLIPLLANIDHRKFDVHLFSIGREKDRITEKLGHYADMFHDLSGLSAQQVVEHIQTVDTDVLIDLGGHTRLSPLRYMASQLAPSQVTWLGYPGTTGVDEVQYRISDWTADPEGADDAYTETLLRAPEVFCTYHPLVSAPLDIYADRYRVRPTPALGSGFITFGSCNTISKLTSQTLQLWSAVLANCSSSRLLVEAHGLDNESVKQTLLERLALAGIDTDRVDLVTRDSRNQYLTYHRIDVALDTTPMTGGTTTCDALWMGVPVITREGAAFHRRISATILRAVGLQALVCASDQEYVERAVQLASDIGFLNDLRLSLRQRFEKAPISDAAGFSRWFEHTIAGLVDCGEASQPEVPHDERPIFFGGELHQLGDIIAAVGALLAKHEHPQLLSLLENVTSVWHRHWLVAYAMAEVHHEKGEWDESLALLIEAIGLRSYSLPLYRLLSARMDAYQIDKSALKELLANSFGIELSHLDQSPVPTPFDILGLTLEPART